MRSSWFDYYFYFDFNFCSIYFLFFIVLYYGYYFLALGYGSNKFSAAKASLELTSAAYKCLLESFTLLNSFKSLLSYSTTFIFSALLIYCSNWGGY